jgi:protein pelota
MKVVEVDLKRGVVGVQVETLDDLWVLFNIIKAGDLVYAKTTREVKVGEGSEGVRVPMVLGVRVKKVEFQEFSDKLRIFGLVVEGPEEFGVRGKHHALTIGVGDYLTIVKERWEDFELNLIKRQIRGDRVLVVAIDYDEACIGLVAEQGVKYVWEGHLGLPSKHYVVDYEPLVKAYFKQIVEAAKHALEGYGVKAVIVVGPGELKNQLRKALEESLDVPLYVDMTSTGGCKGVSEALNRDVFKNIMGELSVVRASQILREFKELLVRDHELVVYGLEEVKQAAIIGAVGKLLVLDELLRSPDDQVRGDIYETLRHAYDKKAEVVIVPSKTDIGGELAGFGGVIAILRFKVFKPE